MTYLDGDEDKVEEAEIGDSDRESYPVMGLMGY